MIAALPFVALVALLVLGFSVPVALGLSAIGYMAVVGLDRPELWGAILSSRASVSFESYVLAAIVLFVFFGRLAAQMDVRSRLSTSIGTVFGGGRIAASVGEIVASLAQPDTAGDALLQRNDDAASTVNRLRLAGATGPSAIGQAACLACLRAIMPPSVILIILGLVLEQSVLQLIAWTLPVAMILAALLFLLALPRQGDPAASPRPRGAVDRSAFVWLLPPVIVLVAIFSNWMTPTEAGALAAVTAIILGLLEGELTGRRFLRAIVETMYGVGAILLVIIFASVFVSVLAMQNVPAAISDWVLAIPPGVLLPTTLLVAFAASALGGLSITLFVVAPLALPAMSLMGYDVRSFSVGLALAAVLGLLVPPTGAIFATLAAGSNEPATRTIGGLGYYALGVFVTLAFVLAF